MHCVLHTSWSSIIIKVIVLQDALTDLSAEPGIFSPSKQNEYYAHKASQNFYLPIYLSIWIRSANILLLSIKTLCTQASYSLPITLDYYCSYSTHIIEQGKYFLCTQGMMNSAHAVQLKLESEKLLDTAFEEYPVCALYILICRPHPPECLISALHVSLQATPTCIFN